MKLLNPNGWSCGPLSCTSGANATAEITPTAVPNPVQQQISSAAKHVSKRDISIPEWVRKLAIPIRKDAPKFGLVGPQQLGTWTLARPLTVNAGMTSQIFVATLRVNQILKTIGPALGKDIETVLAFYKADESNTQQTKAVNKEFFRLYALLLKKTSYASFENQAFRNLMRNVAKEISKKPDPINAPSTPRPLVPLAPTSLATISFPGFDAQATNMAFDLIHRAHLQTIAGAQAAVPGSTQHPPAQIESSTNPTVAIPTEPRQAAARASAQAGRQNIERWSQDAYNLVGKLKDLRKLKFQNLPGLLEEKAFPQKAVANMHSNLQSEDKSAEAQERRGEEAIRQAVSDMEVGNTKFRSWLAAHNIEAVANSGSDLNCLIIALEQHATGAYGAEFEPVLAEMAPAIRNAADIEPGMLYSDNDLASRLVDLLNAQHHTNMVLIEVQANELGLPVITTPLDQIPDDRAKVVIWQRGNHFEALRFKGVQETS